ncbi:MAG: UbiA family prenyltransferase [Bacteroidetes bacterium]|nr:UbiA family prenyltransferase [Bacteroidota bacterium]
MRPHTLTAAVMPVLIGTAMAYVEGKFDFPLFAAMLAASVLIQSAVNMFNEYFDYRRGLDTKASVSIGGVIVSHELEGTTVLTSAMVFFLVSILLGIYICSLTSWWIAVIGSIRSSDSCFLSVCSLGSSSLSDNSPELHCQSVRLGGKALYLDAGRWTCGTNQKGEH